MSNTANAAPTRILSNEVKALTDIMGKPNLVGLSYALRHPETWPKDFVWDFNTCNTCAVGLARRLWSQQFAGFPTRAISREAGIKAQESFVARTMAMSHREARRIFFELGPTHVENRGPFYNRRAVRIRDFDAVTADDVADAIDRYLETAA